MTITKRLRILWAACHQDWHELTCPLCHTTWFCASGLCAAQICADCETQQFERWRKLQAETHPEVA